MTEYSKGKKQKGAKTKNQSCFNEYEFILTHGDKTKHTIYARNWIEMLRKANDSNWPYHGTINIQCSNYPVRYEGSPYD